MVSYQNHRAYMVRVARLEFPASWSQKDLGSYFESYSILFGHFRSWCDAFRTSCIHCFRMLRSWLWSKYVVKDLVYRMTSVCCQVDSLTPEKGATRMLPPVQSYKKCRIVPPKVTAANPTACQRIDRCFIVPPRFRDTSIV